MSSTLSRAAALAAMSLTVGALGATVAPDAHAAVTGTVTTHGAALNAHSGPHTASALTGSFANGTRLNIQCQTTGDSVAGFYGTSAIWDKVGANQYVADSYVNTGSNGWVAPQCGTTTPPPTTGRAWGATRTYNGFPSGQCTWGAQQKFHDYSGVYMNISGNAGTWATAARNARWTVSGTPQVNSVVVFPPYRYGTGSAGHVAWVTAVRGNTIDIVEMNWNGHQYFTTRTTTHGAGMQYILAPHR